MILSALRLHRCGNLCTLFTFSPCLLQTCLHWGTVSHRINQLLETKWNSHTLFFLPVQIQRNSVNKHGFSRPSAMFFSLLVPVSQDMLQHIFHRSCFSLSLLYDVQLCTCVLAAQIPGIMQWCTSAPVKLSDHSFLLGDSNLQAHLPPAAFPEQETSPNRFHLQANTNGLERKTVLLLESRVNRSSSIL